MHLSTTVDMEEYQAHQRKVVRHFAPHLSNAALASQERRYFALSVARLALVFGLPSCALFYLHDSSIATSVFAVVSVVCVIELAMAMVRLCGVCQTESVVAPMVYSRFGCDVATRSIGIWCCGRKACACAGITGTRCGSRSTWL